MTISLKYRYALAVAPALAFLPFLASAVQSSSSITGRVKARDGKALPGVLITATRWDDATKSTETTSGEKGEFEVRGLKAGEYVIRLEKSGYRSFTSRKVKVDAGETMRLRSDVELVPESPPFAMIRGAVFTSDGFSLPNANVTIERITEGRKLKREMTSVDGGEFTFKLPAEKATYRITASARGFESASKDIEVDMDEVRQIALSLIRK
jgi:uncharacterized membrane protein